MSKRSKPNNDIKKHFDLAMDAGDRKSAETVVLHLVEKFKFLLETLGTRTVRLYLLDV